jgi:hypothetical protein
LVKIISIRTGNTMSANSYPASAFCPASASTAASVLRELFKSTPLSIFVEAMRAAKANSGQR